MHTQPPDAQPVPTDERLVHKQQQLLAWMGQIDRCLVAFSAGVDSTVVAKAAQLALGERATAVTADSPSLAREELELARQLADEIGISHLVVTTTEAEQPDYRRNDHDRCFHCKTELYTQMQALAEQHGIHVLLNGANLDDTGDYRPGMRAAANFQVRSPLIECRYNKQDVRALAKSWGLPNWEKPAAPCLSSRLAYGLEVTPERLAMVEQGEQFLRSLGLCEFRLRYHPGELARLEVPLEHIARLCEPKTRARIVEHLTALGFRYISLDLAGFQSGSLNRLISIETLTQKQPETQSATDVPG